MILKSLFRLSELFIRDAMKVGTKGFNGNWKADKVLELQRNGVAVIEDFIETAVCDRIVEAISGFFSNPTEQMWVDDELSDYRIFGAELIDSRIRDFSEYSELLNLANIIHRKDSFCYTTLAARLKFTENNLGSGGGWHRDTAIGLRQFKAILYLSDVSPTSGPFEYLKGSHSKWSLWDFFLKYGIAYGANRIPDEDMNRILRDKAYSLGTYTSKKGTLIVANTFGIHRGSPIQAGDRFALTNYYYPIDSNLQYLNSKFNPLLRYP
jgi:hypothetical protein